MKRIIRIMMLLAAMTAAAGEAWARGGAAYGKIIYEKGTDGSDGGELYFYASADDASAGTEELGDYETTDNQVVYNLSKVTLTDGKVYILAKSDGDHTCLSVTFTAEKSGGSDMAQARRYTADDSGVQVNSIKVSAVSGKPGVYCFEMPADGMNVTISAKFAAKATNTDDISYIDADGVTKTKDAGSVYVLEGTEYWLGVKDKDTWYVCNSTLDYKHELEVYGDIHLILADEAKMSVEGVYGIHIGQKSLTIYGQSTGADMGSLNATGKDGAGIIGNVLSSVTINGGEVTATGYHGINVGNSVTINGGKVTATATGEEGYGIRGGDIILGWNSATDYITATSYDTPGYVRTADSKVLKYTDDDSQTVTLMGTLDDDAIAGKTLTPYGIFGYCGKDDPKTTDADESKNVTWEIPIVDGATGSTLTISGTGEMADYMNNNASNFAPWLKPDADGNASAGLKYPVTAVNIGEGVTSIGRKAFDSCGGLTSVTIGEGVNTIGEDAFMSCYGITSVNIPASVTEIGNDAFSGCAKLTTVTVNRNDSGITTLGSDVFIGCDKLTLILVPDEAAYNEYYDGFGWGDYKAKLAPQTLTVAKNASGWGTYCHNFPVSYSLSEGATAYTVGGISTDENGVTTVVAEAASDNLVAAETPLLLGYTGEGSVTLTAVPATAKANDHPSYFRKSTEMNVSTFGNMTDGTLKHTTDDDGIPELTDLSKGWLSYVLVNGVFQLVSVDEGTPGHRWVLRVSRNEIGGAVATTIGINGATTTQPATNLTSIVSGGTLTYYNDDEGLCGEALTAEEALEAGATYYVQCKPDFGYTMKGFSIMAQVAVASSVAQARSLAPQVGAGVTLSAVDDMPGLYSFEMPAGATRLTVSAAFPEKECQTGVSYMTWDGTQQKLVEATTPEGTYVYVLDGSETELGLSGKDDDEKPYVTWYMVPATATGDDALSYNGGLRLNGDVRLILADGGSVTLNGNFDDPELDPMYAFWGKDCQLTVYGQAQGTGKLDATTDAMAFSIGALTISGGDVNVNGKTVFSGNSLIVYGGAFTSESATVNNTSITAKSIEIYGGQVTIAGAIQSAGDITLGWTGTKDHIKASNYIVSAEGHYVSIAKGKMLKYTGSDNATTTLKPGIVMPSGVTAIAGKELTPGGYFGYCGNPDENSGWNVTWSIVVDDPATTDADESEILVIEKNPIISGQDVNYDMADYDENGGPWKKLSPVVATIGSGVTAIGANAFAGCEKLKLILVPDMTAYDAFAKQVSDADQAKLAPNVMSVAKNASGWSTYCHRFPVSYSAEGATAYTVSGLSISGENVSVTATTGNIVAPAVPLLLGYTGTDDITLTAAPATATTPPADAIVSYSGTGFTYYGNPSGTANLSTAEITDCVYVYPNTAGQQSYVLSEGAFIMVNGTTGGIAPHRCWLNIAGSNAARALTIGGDETTGVKEREAHKYSPDIYTLDGRKVNGKPTKKGMYINGDRKVVIK